MKPLLGLKLNARTPSRHVPLAGESEPLTGYVVLRFGALSLKSIGLSWKAARSG